MTPGLARISCIAIFLFAASMAHAEGPYPCLPGTNRGDDSAVYDLPSGTYVEYSVLRAGREKLRLRFLRSEGLLNGIVTPTLETVFVVDGATTAARQFRGAPVLQLVLRGRILELPDAPGGRGERCVPLRDLKQGPEASIDTPLGAFRTVATRSAAGTSVFRFWRSAAIPITGMVRGEVEGGAIYELIGLGIDGRSAFPVDQVPLSIAPPRSP